MSSVEIVAVSVGNTRTRVGVFREGALEHARAVANASVEDVLAAIREAPAQSGEAPIVVASVNPPVESRLADELSNGPRRVLRLGRDLPIPIEHALRDDSTVGQDRLLNALGAFSRAKQACVVVDAGTAMTVDFVDGQGVFQGGAIAPGVRMMLRALHAQTAALPEIDFEPVPGDAPFGKDTREAMRLGVQSAARGVVRTLVERYAEAFGAYPQIVATGGDAAVLFEHDDLVEHIVPDLTLMGIQAACQRLLDDEE